MIRTTWDLGAHTELDHLRLRKWAHMLGFRGHFSTKSRRYSTTLTALRQARADYRAATATTTGNPDGAALTADDQRGHGGDHQPQRQIRGHREQPDDTVLVVAHWRFAGQGYSPGESILAAAFTPTRTRRPDPGGPPCPRSC